MRSFSRWCGASLLPATASSLFSAQRRGLVLRPESTVDPERYPQGYVALTGHEPIEAVYALLVQGHLVAPQRLIETVHTVYQGVRLLCASEYPILSVQDIVTCHARTSELLSRILIPRDFWTLEDFNDPELNSSFGVQNLYFDNYKWSQVLWRRFQSFVDHYFPLGEHSHLLYAQYVQLIRSFAVFEQGTVAYPVLPRAIKLHPPYGSTALSKSALEPLVLLKRWVGNFRPLLRLSSALVVRASSAVVPFVVRMAGVPMVRGVDPSPRAIEACRNDARADRRLSTVSFQVAELFPEANGEATRRTYDLVVYYPDDDIVSTFWNDGDGVTNFVGGFGDSGHATTSRTTRFSDDLSYFFERVGEYLSESGVVAICCTNVNSLLHPHVPHPIEFEVKHNRRFVIMDYYDAPMRHRTSSLSTKKVNGRVNHLYHMADKVRSELWILHKVEAIHRFGYIHGIPGAKPPPTALHRQARAKMRQRRAVLKQHAELMGVEWGDYKSRMASMMQEQCDEPEDDYAEVVRMASDPTYPAELANRARTAVEANIAADAQFHKSVAQEYGDSAVSPRDAFDRKWLS